MNINKLLFAFFALFFSFGALTASAYTIQPGDTLSKIGSMFDVSVEDLVSYNNIQNPDLIYAGEKIGLPQEGLFGALVLPTDGYDSFLSAPLGSSDTSVFVNALPSGVTSSVYTIFASDGRTVAEKIFCTDKSSSPSKLSGCTRGLSLTPNSDGSINEIGGAGSSHSKNARIAITDTINFTGKALSILSGYQKTSSTNFIVGDGSSSTIKIFFQTGTTTTSAQYLWADNNAGRIGYSDGISTYTFADGSSGLLASSTKGIGIENSRIHIIASSTLGMAFDNNGSLYQKTSSTGGILADSLGLYVDTSDDFSFTSAIFNIATAASWRLGGVAFTGTMALLNEAVTFFNATDITGTEAESLTAGTNVTSSLHIHGDTALGNYSSTRYRTMPLDFTVLAATEQDGAFVITNMPYFDYQSAAAGWYTSIGVPGQTAGHTQFDDGKDITFSVAMKATNGTTGDRRVGLAKQGAGLDLVYNSSAQDYVGCAFDGATAYAVTADEGVGATATNISSGFTATNFNVCTVEWDAGNSAKFYVNGVHRATHTTNLPNGANDISFGLGGETNGEDWIFMAPILDIEF